LATSADALLCQAMDAAFPAPENPKPF